MYTYALKWRGTQTPHADTRAETHTQRKKCMHTDRQKSRERQIRIDRENRLRMMDRAKERGGLRAR
jgi:hypothetical protein